MPKLTDTAEAFVSRLDRGESVEDVASDLWYGVEIEFADAGDLGVPDDCPYDEDFAEESLNESALYVLASRLPGGDTQQGRRIAGGILDNMSLEEAINGCTEFHWSDLVEWELESLQDGWEGDGGSFDDVSGWEHCEDGTSGIVQEYKTDSPRSLNTTVERLHRLFDRAGDDCEVPNNGSCHVHVSIPGCEHMASENSRLHACILFELSQLVGEFPSKLWGRINSQYEDRFFALNEQCQSKFTAVHCHSQGTWEFRLFGGLDDADDCATCVSIAGRAMLAGYARFRAGNYAIENIGEFREAFREAILAEKPMPVSAIEPSASPCSFVDIAIGHNFTSYDSQVAELQCSNPGTMPPLSDGVDRDQPSDNEYFEGVLEDLLQYVY